MTNNLSCTIIVVEAVEAYNLTYILLFIAHDIGGDEVKLNEIASVRSGLVLSRKLAREGTKYPLLTLRSINPDGYIDLDKTDVFDAKEELAKEYLTQEGDIVIRLSTPYTAVYIDKASEGIVVSSNFVIIRTDNKVLLPEYLYWLLNTAKVKHEMFESSSSNMLGAVKAMFFAEYDIDLIPISEQRKIAAVNTLAKKESRLLMELAKEKERYYSLILQNKYKEIKGENMNDNKK